MPKYASSEQTIQALINAAGELAADKGFANVSTRAVAARAGANISSIHYHFGSKEGLFEAVLRRIIEHINRNSYRQAMVPFEDELDSPEGQARAVAAIVRRHLAGFFDKTKPWWFPKIMYQVLQYDTHLYRIVFAEFIEPMNEVVFELLERIRPGMSIEDKALYNVLLLSLPAMHSDYRLPIQSSLEMNGYSDSYLGKLEEMSIRVVQQALGLPVMTGEES